VRKVCESYWGQEAEGRRAMPHVHGLSSMGVHVLRGVNVPQRSPYARPLNYSMSENGQVGEGEVGIR